MRIDEGDSFCRVCGTPAEGAGVNQAATGGSCNQQNNYMAPQYAAYPGQTVKKGVSGKTIAIIAGTAAVVILAAVLFIVLRGGSSSPMGTVEKFVKATNEADAEAFLSCLDTTSPEVSDLVMDKARLEEQLKQSGGAKVKISKVLQNQVTGNDAVITIEVEVSEPGSDEPDIQETIFTLKKLSGGWKITNIE
jgi:uncharacterized membrane protein YvbJ